MAKNHRTLNQKFAIFRHILFSIFKDRCEDVSDDKIVDFYNSLLSFFESISNSMLNSDNDDFFIYETIIYIIRQFDIIDPNILYQFIKNPDTFRDVMAEQLKQNKEHIASSMENICSEFNGFKEGYMNR